MTDIGEKPKRTRKVKEIVELDEKPEPNIEPAEVVTPTNDEQAAYARKAAEIAGLLGASIVSQSGAELVLYGQKKVACNMDNYDNAAQAVSKLRAMGA